MNRSLMIVTAKQPFLEWAHAIDPEDNSELDDINDEPTAYLVPECETRDQQQTIVDWCAEFVFDHELWLWCTDEDLWPTGRDAAMFREWFDVDFHSMVNDIVGDIPLLHVGYEDDDEDEIDASSNGH
ncbi:MAG TPA: hypothetical protein VI306_20610 [Pyrinomonadaceae bacterium]